VLIVLEIPRQQ